jgi:response regulator RpfG family c-di-GMP phosphodiesterase
MKDKSYSLLVEFWLKEFKPDYCFKAVDGLKMKSIIKQIKHKLTHAGNEPTEENILNSFKLVCLKLPEWYKTKDLSIIDSKFNQIVEEIKANGKSNTEKRAKQIDADFERVANQYLQGN